MSGRYENVATPLRVPRNSFQELLRRLAEAAMSITHHDAADSEPGYIHEVEAMERRFAVILKGKVKPMRPAQSSPSTEKQP